MGERTSYEYLVKIEAGENKRETKYHISNGINDKCITGLDIIRYINDDYLVNFRGKGTEAFIMGDILDYRAGSAVFMEQYPKGTYAVYVHGRGARSVSMAQAVQIAKEGKFVNVKYNHETERIESAAVSKYKIAFDSDMLKRVYLVSIKDSGNVIYKFIDLATAEVRVLINDEAIAFIKSGSVHNAKIINGNVVMETGRVKDYTEVYEAYKYEENNKKSKKDSVKPMTHRTNTSVYQYGGGGDIEDKRSKITVLAEIQNEGEVAGYVVYSEPHGLRLYEYSQLLRYIRSYGGLNCYKRYNLLKRRDVIVPSKGKWEVMSMEQLKMTRVMR